MADDETVPVFDPTMKKKKKKKVDLNLDDEGAGEEAPVAEVTEKVEDLGLDDLDFGKKKKKKKKTDGEDSAEAAVAAAEGGEGGDDEDFKMSDLSALPSKKKKKKKKDIDLGDLDDIATGDEPGEADTTEEKTRVGSGLPWDGTTRDYHYEEILGRIFGMLRANNPELAGEKHKTILKPPEVLREGTKKTVFVNFMELCKAMHRQPDHVMGYLHAELGTSGSLDGQQRLIMKGRFTPKVFEGILRRYVNEYVICNMCKSTDTLLVREQRLFILRCQQCGASRSVQAIKTGFVAQVGRRKRA